MDTSWQDIVALGLVAWAAGYLVLRWALARRNWAGHCGGCAGCPAAQSPPLIEIGPPPQDRPALPDR